MKSIERQSYPDKEVTIFTGHGVISADTILKELHDYYGGQPTLHSLWDFSEADLTSISSDDISSLANYIRQQIANRHGGKSALVFAKDLDFGLGRMIDAQLEIEGSPVAMSSFKSKAEALGWLDTSLIERDPQR